ncbi:hypothetical protein L0F63_007496, partial [Massospora cicadina]
MPSIDEKAAASAGSTRIYLQYEALVVCRAGLDFATSSVPLVVPSSYGLSQAISKRLESISDKLSALEKTNIDAQNALPTVCATEDKPNQVFVEFSTATEQFMQ